MKKSSETKTRNSALTRRRKCPRGWPVVATGRQGIEDFNRYITWRTLLELPEESTDFSDRDVFDVAAYVLDRFGGDRFSELQKKFPQPAPAADAASDRPAHSSLHPDSRR